MAATEFCKDGAPKTLDYCLHVLQMELFLRVFMDITCCDYDHAEENMIGWSTSVEK